MRTGLLPRFEGKLSKWARFNKGFKQNLPADKILIDTAFRQCLRHRVPLLLLYSSIFSLLGGGRDHFGWETVIDCRDPRMWWSFLSSRGPIWALLPSRVAWLANGTQGILLRSINPTTTFKTTCRGSTLTYSRTSRLCGRCWHGLWKPAWTWPCSNCSARLGQSSAARTCAPLSCG